jgi:hypothetical protein
MARKCPGRLYGLKREPTCIVRPVVNVFAGSAFQVGTQVSPREWPLERDSNEEEEMLISVWSKNSILARHGQVVLKELCGRYDGISS